MNNEFDHALDDCIARLRSGTNLNECLLAYPFYADELQPLLKTYLRIHSIPKPTASRASIRKSLERLRETNVNLGSRNPFKRNYLGYVRWAVVTGLVLLITGFLAIDISAKSLPGDSFYDLKRGWEQVRLSMTIEEGERNKLSMHYQDERIEEIRTLIQLRRPEKVEFEGILEQISGYEWSIDGMSVILDDSTVVEGNPQLNEKVEVVAHLQADGTMLAITINVEEDEKPERIPTATPEAGLVPKELPQSVDDNYSNFKPKENNFETDDSTLEVKETSNEYDRDDDVQERSSESQYFKEYKVVEETNPANSGESLSDKRED